MGFVTIWMNTPVTLKHNNAERINIIKANFTITDFKEILEVEKQLQSKE
jgi:hypothetical protein